MINGKRSVCTVKTKMETYSEVDELHEACKNSATVEKKIKIKFQVDVPSTLSKKLFTNKPFVPKVLKSDAPLYVSNDY